MSTTILPWIQENPFKATTCLLTLHLPPPRKLHIRMNVFLTRWGVGVGGALRESLIGVCRCQTDKPTLVYGRWTEKHTLIYGISCEKDPCLQKMIIFCLLEGRCTTFCGFGKDNSYILVHVDGQFTKYQLFAAEFYQKHTLCYGFLVKIDPLLRIIYEKETLLFGTDAHKSTLLSGTLLITFIEQVPPPRVLITSPRNSLVPGGRQSLSWTNADFL